MIVTVKCPQCGQQFSKEFDTTKVNRVVFGELVQDDEDIECDYPDDYIEDLIELNAEEFADSK